MLLIFYVHRSARCRHGGTQVLSRKRIAKLFRICWIMLHNQKCTGMDAGARRYAPWTAHKSRFRRASKTKRHNSYRFL